MNKVSRGKEITAELFQILKDDSVKVVLNMLANLENSEVATRLEKVNFHSNPKEGQCKRMFKLPYNHTHFTHYREGNGNPLQYSCLENPMDRGAWRATVHGVAKSQTRLK